eukprot:1967471-Pyramimonas_sp.AAC.1
MEVEVAFDEHGVEWGRGECDDVEEDEEDVQEQEQKQEDFYSSDRSPPRSCSASLSKDSSALVPEVHEQGRGDRPRGRGRRHRGRGERGRGGGRGGRG